MSARAIHLPPDPSAPRLPDSWPKPPPPPEEPPPDPVKPPKHEPSPPEPEIEPEIPGKEPAPFEEPQAPPRIDAAARSAGPPVFSVGDPAECAGDEPPRTPWRRRPRQERSAAA